MPLLTVRLTDEEHAALKKLAAGSSMAEVIRAWISAGFIPKTISRTINHTITVGAEFHPVPKPGKTKR